MTPQNLESFAGLKISKSEDVQSKGDVYIIYGQGGVGKTTLAAEIAESEFVKRGTLWLTMDGNTKSISNLIRSGRIQEVEIKRWSELQKMTDSYIREQPWDAVAIDNMSEGQSIDLRDITGGARQPEIQEYGLSEAHMISLIRKWRDIARANDINVFILFWEMQVNKGAGTKDDLHVTNKLAAKLAGIVGNVMHLTSETDKDITRKITIAGPSTRTAAKFTRDRTDSVQWTIPNEIYYRLDQTPLIDILNTIRNGVTFPAAKYQRKATTNES
jgi:phage nucleotide-binding protein